MNASVQTFVAVILGAVLATVGGFVATQAGIWMDRSRRARSAALLCGEILAGVETLLRMAEVSSLRGTFLDPLPSRFLRTARREIDVYDRNRELLFTLGNADTRARLHGFIVRLSIPLDRFADDRARYTELCSVYPEPLQRLAELKSEMEGTFEYLMSSRKLIPELLSVLRPLAQNPFDSYSRIDTDGNFISNPN